MNLERLKTLRNFFLLFLALVLGSQTLGSAAPKQAQSATQAIPQPAELGTLTEVAPPLFAITEAGGNGNHPSVFLRGYFSVDRSELDLSESGGQRVSMRVNGNLNWLVSDHLGSASVTANADGSFKSQIQYTVFGEIRADDPNFLSERVGSRPRGRVWAAHCL